MVDTPAKAIQLKNSQLYQLREKLRDGLPTTNGLRVSVQNAARGRVDGNFFVDLWPNFSMVVFRCRRPSLSGAGDLHCYANSLEAKQKLASFLGQAGLLQMDGGAQYLYLIEDAEKSVAEHLERGLKMNGKLNKASGKFTNSHYSLYLMTDPPKQKAVLPSGYTFGNMSGNHIGLVSSQEGLWLNTCSGPTAQLVQDYISQCMETLETAAVYSDNDLTTPVAGVSCYSVSGEYGDLFTVKQHRRKGLASALIMKISEHYFSQGDMPQATIEPGNHTSVQLHLKLGFVCVGSISWVCLYL
jgi:GNAT superfamily N-acetyltransferase